MKKFIFSIMMALALVVAMLPIQSNAAVKNLTCMPTSTRAYCKITLDDATYYNRKTKYAKVTVKIGDGINWTVTSPYYRVVLTDDKGRWLWESSAHSLKGSTTFKLGNDHKTYRMYFYCDNRKLSKTSAFTNTGKFGYVNITKAVNCKSVKFVRY